MVDGGPLSDRRWDAQDVFLAPNSAWTVRLD
jgi:hypothetical protein